MSAVAAGGAMDARVDARRWLQRSAAAWGVVAVAGQWFLATYMLWVYGGSAMRGDVAGYNRVLSKAYVAGEPVLNAVLAVHLAFGAVLMIGGALQLLPMLRRAAPAVHRWNGRVYVVAALLMSVAGLWYSATRAQVGDAWQHAGVGGNALAVLVLAVLAWRQARARRFEAHRRWALRLFLAVSGVWFFRLGLTLWIAVNRGPAGFDPETFTGPALSILAFAQYLLPLAVLEAYFAAQRSRSAAPKWAMSAGLALAALLTMAGTATAAMMLWLPRMH